MSKLTDPNISPDEHWARWQRAAGFIKVGGPMPCSFSVKRFTDECSGLEMVRVRGRVDTVERDDDPTSGRMTGTYMQEETLLERMDIEQVFWRVATALYQHELAEWYKVDGIRVRDPHIDYLARTMQGAPQEGLSVEKS